MWQAAPPPLGAVPPPPRVSSSTPQKPSSASSSNGGASADKHAKRKRDSSSSKPGGAGSTPDAGGKKPGSAGGGRPSSSGSGGASVNIAKWREAIRSEFVVDMQFQAPLPDVPLGPRFLKMDSLANLGNLVGYRDTLPLATKFKYELTSSVSLGIEVDTVDSKKWNPPHLPSARTHQHARLPPMHPDDAALLEWDRFRGKAAKHEVEDGEEDNGGIATAGQVEAPWMLRPLYETAPTLRAEEEDGRGGQKKRIKKEEEDEEEDEDEVFDESTQEGWQAAIERTFEETRNKQGLVPRVKGGKQPLWVAEVLPDLEQWANDLVVVHFGNEMRGREEEAAKEAPLFLVEGGGGGGGESQGLAALLDDEEGEGNGGGVVELKDGAVLKAEYLRGEAGEGGGGGGGMVCKAYEPARYYKLQVERTQENSSFAAGGGGGEKARRVGMLLLVQPESGHVRMCPTLGDVRVKKLDRAASAKPPRGVRLVHRGLNDEEKEAREMKLMRAGVDEEAAAEVRN